MDFLPSRRLQAFSYFLLASGVVLAHSDNIPVRLEECQENFVQVGCYKDKTRPLPKLLLNMRNSELRTGGDNWEEFLKRLACRCAEKTRREAYTYFGLQFYGECWSGVKENVTYDNDGISRGCVGEKPRKRCRHVDRVCVGKAKRNFIYRLIKPTSSADCKDDRGDCVNYKGYCDYEYVQNVCRHTCKMC